MVLRTARVKRRLRQADVATIVGVTQPTISAWENDLGAPTWAHLVVLARHLNIPVNDLLAATP